MQVIETQRVRALIFNGENEIFLIKRIKPGFEPYWVIPGGRVEVSDESLEAALHREVMEELGATVEIKKLIHVLASPRADGSIKRQSVFLCQAITCNPDERSGDEFKDPSRGLYEVQQASLTPKMLREVNLMPRELRLFLLTQHERLAFLPDLRVTEPL